MKKVFCFLPVLFLIVLMSCNKDQKCGFTDSNKTAPETEQNALQDSLEKYNISANLAPAGFFYRILDPGTDGIVSNLCSKITVTYWGGFFNGKGFDSTATPVPYLLGQLMIAWQKAIPLVKGGGEINIYVPPSLGYGDRNVSDGLGKVIIPAHSYLVFKVQVKSIE